jgi:hypothetical protein
MKNPLFIILLFLFSVIHAQNATLSLKQSTSYNTTYVVTGSLFGGGGSGPAPYDPVFAGRLGLNLNIPIYKKISLDVESGYALGGFRNDALSKNEYYHQAYLSLAPQYDLGKAYKVGLGLLGDYKFYTKLGSGFNFGYSINISKSFKKLNIGFRFIDFTQDHNNLIYTKYIPRLYELNLTYRLKTY